MCSSDDETASLAASAEKKRPEERTEQEKVAIMGRPRLGDVSRAQIRIKESKEFKVRGCSLSISILRGCSRKNGYKMILMIIIGNEKKSFKQYVSEVNLITIIWRKTEEKPIENRDVLISLIMFV